MRLGRSGLHLSATDLSAHLGCPHLTQLDRAAAEGRAVTPIWTDPILEMLKERGIQHEAAYANHLRAGGLSVVEVGHGGTEDQVADLMRAGTDVILQAPLVDGRFNGYADFLRKVAHRSELGPFSYEVIDTKLALETRAGTILQLCLYSSAVAKIQGGAPEFMHVSDLLQEGVTWTDRDQVVRPLTAQDVLIVAPYNAQIAALKRALPGMRIGTVDKFQGQEAPVVIYSMASSSPEDAPRGMGFLYNPNRLNVATSRARSACILVASPRLFEPECRSPEQMRWANGLCRYRELATET